MANKVYVHEGTRRVFKNTGGDTALTLTSVAAGAGRISAQWDRDGGVAAARPMFFEWRLVTKVQTGGVVGEAIEIYIVTSDGTNADGNFATTDSSVTNVNFLKNLQYVGSIFVEQTGANVIIGSKLFEVRSRYVQVLVWNRTSAILSATASDHTLYLTPMPDELQ